MENTSAEAQFFGREKIWKILLKIAPPVMLAQLIQALYNIVDSLFVGRYAESGLTALSIIYPIQLLMMALAIGTGVGINTAMAARFGVGKRAAAQEFAGIGTPLAGILWVLIAVLTWLLMPAYARLSSTSQEVIGEVVLYGRIVCVFSFGLFFESIWTKILQAEGDMKTPMVAQILGAVTNIVLDPLLIFGLFGLPRMGIAGAAAATVMGQVVAALVVMKKGFRKSPGRAVYPRRVAEIFRLGIPSILMQSAYTVYILGLNLILSRFSDQAVTALGLYYKWQTFFFIPLSAMQTCIVPIVSFNYAARRIHRCKVTLITAVLFGMALMAVGTLCFEAIPAPMLRVFTSDERVVEIGRLGFRFIGVSFIPMVTSLVFPVFFQAVGAAVKSSLLTVVDLSGHRDPDQPFGCGVLPAVPGPSLCKERSADGSGASCHHYPALAPRRHHHHRPGARLLRQGDRQAGCEAVGHPFLLQGNDGTGRSGERAGSGIHLRSQPQCAQGAV